MSDRLTIAGVDVAPGERVSISIPVARRYTHAEVAIPTHVIRGRKAGPTLFVSAAIHGDEINGVEIIRRLVREPQLTRLRGTLIAVPVVNVYGFTAQSRYLPDRRDLNRSFPGSPSGSLAARLADTFMTQIVRNATHGLDIHSGTAHRTNLPQVRVRLDSPEVLRLARSFGTPVVLNSPLRDGSLRAAAGNVGIPVLLYEAGEALRFDEESIRAGVRGVRGLMAALDMLPVRRSERALAEPFTAQSSFWVRAPASGILRTKVRLGARVDDGDVLGIISDPLGDANAPVTTAFGGIVIGMSNLPLVNEGDALVHVAKFERPAEVESGVVEFSDRLASGSPWSPGDDDTVE